jgi:nitroreductase
VFVAASWAPNCFNEQPWRFIVGHKGDAVFGQIMDALIGFNKQWAGTAPVLFLTAAKKTFSRNGSPSEFHIHDTGLASAMLSLQATAFGFHTHGMAGFDKTKAREAFSIRKISTSVLPGQWVTSVIRARFPKPNHAFEKSPRSRKPLEEFVFSEWDKPATFGP